MRGLTPAPRQAHPKETAGWLRWRRTESQTDLRSGEEEEQMGQERQGRFRRRSVGGRRPHVTKISHSADEWERVTALASAQGVSVPRLYERALHLGDAQAASKVSRVVDELHIIERVMSKTAVNINQMATVANVTGEVSAPQITAAARHLEGQVERVIALLEQLTGGDRFERFQADDDSE